MSEHARVLVTHAGARHNYALPAAFADADMLEAFYTDLCGGVGIGRLASLVGALPLPGAIGGLARRLANRTPPEAVLARTRTDDIPALLFERAARAAGSPQEVRRLQLEYVEGAGERMARWGLGSATHMFSVFGFPGQLAAKANERGIPVLTDMIIALSTRFIQLKEYDAFPDWGPPPPDKPYSREDAFNPDELMLQTTDIFVCPSAFVRDDLIENYGIAAERTRLVPYALHSDWFDLQPETQPGRVLFVGSADRRKGIHYLAKAATQLGDIFDFRVAGGVDDAVRNHPEAGQLNFLGRVPRDAVKGEFASADIFVLPTLAEGSATVVYEAMAAGLPVVTTKAAGSLVRDGIDGIIVPERDPEALASAVEKIYRDRDMRDAMGRSAREQARQCNWDNYAAALREIVRETPSPIADRRSFRSTYERGTAT